MFDINPKLIGLVIRGIEIRSVDDLETFIRENEIQIAALTIPKTKAPEIADRLVNAGIRLSGILPIRIWWYRRMWWWRMCTCPRA